MFLSLSQLPYVEMTRRMLEVFPRSGGVFQIEPDASTASYFYAVNAMFPDASPVQVVACQPSRSAGGSGWQIDAEFPRLTPTAPTVEERGSALGRTTQFISRGVDLGDSIMTAITIAPLAKCPFHFTNLGVLRKQEIHLSSSDATPSCPVASTPSCPICPTKPTSSRATLSHPILSHATPHPNQVYPIPSHVPVLFHL